MVTAPIMTPDSVSSRSDHATSTPPAAIQVTSGTIRVLPWSRISANSTRPSSIDRSSAPQVTIWAPRSPIARPKKPAIMAASKGRKRTGTANGSDVNVHENDDRNRAAVQEIDNEDGEADRGLGRRHGQHE